jgi:hypothetical protein
MIFVNSFSIPTTTVDVMEDMGKRFEDLPVPQWDLPTNFEHGVFPPKTRRYQETRRAENAEDGC